MNWKRMSQWYLQQQGTGYTVSKALVMGEPRYSAWAPKPHKYASAKLLDVKDTPQEAMQVCEDHRRANRK